jgi:hypothetical protein
MRLRAGLHERFADWLEHKAGEGVSEHVEILGYHLEQAHHYRAELLGDSDATRQLARCSIDRSDTKRRPARAAAGRSSYGNARCLVRDRFFVKRRLRDVTKEPTTSHGPACAFDDIEPRAVLTGGRTAFSSKEGRLLVRSLGSVEHETNLAPRSRLKVKPGQQTGSKRLKSASVNHAESSRAKPGKPHQ